MNLYSLEDLKDLLEKHDWYYTFSDDYKVYRKGVKSEALIKKVVKEVGAPGETLYKQYVKQNLGDHGL
tara:strand:- start:3777 stop:3980 length:204 start_codon:yes stop_codon:yes gene_type:complete